MKAIVRGRDIGKSVIGAISEVQGNARRVALSIENLCEYTKSYRRARLEVLCEDDDNEAEIASLIDRTDTLLCLHSAYCSNHRTGDIDDFKKFIESFFKDSKGDKATIVLSTGHRAKGLEYPRVFILGYDKLLESNAKSDEAQEQEENLRYVMVTRVLWDANNPHSGTLFLCQSE